MGKILDGSAAIFLAWLQPFQTIPDINIMHADHQIETWADHVI
jgi:hypothetical protein